MLLGGHPNRKHIVNGRLDKGEFIQTGSDWERASQETSVKGELRDRFV